LLKDVISMLAECHGYAATAVVLITAQFLVNIFFVKKWLYGDPDWDPESIKRRG